MNSSAISCISAASTAVPRSFLLPIKIVGNTASYFHAFDDDGYIGGRPSHATKMLFNFIMMALVP